MKSRATRKHQYKLTKNAQLNYGELASLLILILFDEITFQRMKKDFR